MMANRKQPLLLSALLLLILCLQGAGSFQSADSRLTDRLCQQKGLADPNIHVIGIDETTLTELGPFHTWSRKEMAKLIRILNQDPSRAPAVIGIDVGFYGEENPETDRELAEAVREAGNVVLVSNASFGKEIVETDEGFRTRTAVRIYEEPFDMLKEAAAAVGHTYTVPDRDGIIRHAVYSLDREGETVNNFSCEIARIYTGTLPEKPKDENVWYLPYTGGPYDYYGSSSAGLSFSRVLNGEIPTELFAGSIVLVGAYSTGMMDNYFTPVSYQIPMHGVEIHANMVQALLERNGKADAPLWSGLLVTLLAGCIVLTLFQLSRTGVILGAVVLLSAGIIGNTMTAYSHGWVVPAFYPLTAVWLLYLVHILYEYVEERLARKRVVRLFERYVSPQVATQIEMETGDIWSGRRKDVAVLFTDIRSFTTMSETVEPEQTVRLLNRYFGLTTKAVFENQGTVDKFIGDSMMAVFNAPQDLEDYVYRAVRAAAAMRAGADELGAEFQRETGVWSGFGVGIHCGPVVIGNIGTEFRTDYTAIGDTVNVAARLEGLAAPGEILISGEVYERLKGRIEAEYLGVRALKGKKEEIIVYKVIRICEEKQNDEKALWT